VTGVVPRLSIIGNYRVNGKVLVLPIQGEGKCNLTIDDVEIRGKFTPDVIIKNGKEYLQAKNLKLTFDTSR
jgi:Haemolymph juvenile hormone binding protein (JHBP)